MRGMMLVALISLVATASFAQQTSPPVTFPDLPVTDATVKKLQGQLAACEKEKKQLAALFDAAHCPAKTTPVYCSVDGNTMSYIGAQKCWASILQNCNAPDRYGKVFCADCQDTPVVHVVPTTPHIYYPPPYVHGTTTRVVYYRPRALFCTGLGIRRRCR